MQRRTEMVLYILLGMLLAGVLVFMLIPSRVNTRFAKIERSFVATQQSSQQVFTMEELTDYPRAIQDFFIKGGYIGTKKMSGLKAYYADTSFSLGLNKPTITIDYTQLNRADRPERYAKIQSHIYGLPFEGLDSYTEGTGAMEGYLAKFFRLFNQRGSYMDKASLVTYLAEAFFLPSVALSKNIVYEEIDTYTVRATIRYEEVEASGMFTFSETGEMLKFTTSDRMAASFDGTLAQIPWTAECTAYATLDGRRVPTCLKATWHYPEGDLTYFDGKDVHITFF